MKEKIIAGLTVGFMSLLLLTSCQNKPSKRTVENQFKSSEDTLKVKMSKVKGGVLFRLGYRPPPFSDTINSFENKIIYPEGIDSLQIASLEVDYNAHENKTFVEVIKGYKNGKPVFVVDENNNNDLRDDLVRELKEMPWRTDENLIKTFYSISKEGEMVEDFSWLQIGMSKGGTILSGKREYLLGEITIDNKPYSFGIVDRYNLTGFNYEKFLNAAILSKGSEKINSLSDRNFLLLGEIFDFNGSYYRFDGITNDGSYVTLIKDVPLAQNTGIQLGVKAPEFSVVSTEGEQLTSQKLHDKIIVIANSCACGGDIESSQAVVDIEKTFGSEVHVLHIDNTIKKALNTYQVDTQIQENKDFNQIYRKAYCSRLVYIIGKDRIILDKFNVKKWQEFLPEIIRQNN